MCKGDPRRKKKKKGRKEKEIIKPSLKEVLLTPLVQDVQYPALRYYGSAATCVMICTLYIPVVLYRVLCLTLVCFSGRGTEKQLKIKKKKHHV